MSLVRAATTPGRAGSNAAAHAATKPRSARTPAGVEIDEDSEFEFEPAPKTSSPSGLVGSHSRVTRDTSALNAAADLAGGDASSASASRITSRASSRKSLPAKSGKAFAAAANAAVAAVLCALGTSYGNEERPLLESASRTNAGIEPGTFLFTSAAPNDPPSAPKLAHALSALAASPVTARALASRSSTSPPPDAAPIIADRSAPSAASMTRASSVNVFPSPKNARADATDSPVPAAD